MKKTFKLKSHIYPSNWTLNVTNTTQSTAH